MTRQFQKLILIFLMVFFGNNKLLHAQQIISSNTTWSGNVFLSQKVIVQPGATLTILPNTNVSIGFVDINGDGAGEVELVVNGKLNIMADDCNRVNFAPFNISSNKRYWTGISINSLLNNDSIQGFSIFNADTALNIKTEATITSPIIESFGSFGVYYMPQQTNTTLNLNNAIIKKGNTGIYLDNANSKINLDWCSVDSCLNGVIAKNGSIKIVSSRILNSSRLGLAGLDANIELYNSLFKKNYGFGIINSSGVLTMQNCKVDSNSLGGVCIAGISNNDVQYTNITNNLGSQIEITDFKLNITQTGIISSPYEGNPSIMFNNNNIIGDTLSSFDDNQGLFSLYSNATGGCWESGGPLFGQCNYYFTNSCSTNGINGNSSPTIFYTVLGRLSKLWVAYGASISSNMNTRCFGMNIRDKNSSVNLGGTLDCAGPFQALGLCINNPTQGGTFNVTATDEQEKYLYVNSSGSTSGNFLVTASANIAYYKFGGDIIFNNIRTAINPQFNFQNNNFGIPNVKNALFDIGNSINYGGFTVFPINNAGLKFASKTVEGNLYPTTYLQTSTNKDTVCGTFSNFSLYVPTSANAIYEWYYNGNLFQTTSINNYQIPAAGLWSCIIKTPSCTTYTNERNIVLKSVPPVNILGNTSVCQGQQLTLTANGANSYLWSNGYTTSSITFTPSNSMTLNVTGLVNSCKISVSTNITVNVLPTPTINPSPSILLCPGSQITLTSSQASSYLWSNGETTQSILVNNQGVYSVMVNDLNNCSGSSTTTTVVLVPGISALINPSSSAICVGNNITLTADNASSYLWSNGETTASITVSPMQTTTYSVAVSNANNCTSNASSTITVNSKITPLFNSIGPFCIGTFPSILPLISNNGITGTWSPSVINTSTSGTSSYTFIPSPNSCGDTTNILITVNTLPAIPNIMANSPTTFCAGDSVKLTASAATVYIWSNGATTQSITVSTSGSYSLHVKNSNYCDSPESNPILVTVFPAPIKPTISVSGSATFCQGGSVILTAPTSNYYVWSNGATTQSITVLTSGNYSLHVKNSNYCDSPESSTLAVTVYPTPIKPTISANGATAFCQGGNVTLTAPTSSYYIWSNGATTQSITVSANGSYSLHVKNSNYCDSPESSPIAVTVYPSPIKPTISISGSTTFCQGGSVTLIAPVSDYYIWSNGFTTQNITVTASGSYSLHVKNSNYCDSPESSPVIVTVKPAPQAFINSVQPVCEGDTIKLIGGVADASSYFWIINNSDGSSNGSWAAGYSNSDLHTQYVPGSNDVAKGNITFTLFAQTPGCNDGTKTLSVTIHPAPLLSLQSTNPSNICDGKAVAFVSGGTAPYIYQWSNGFNGSSATGLCGGNYVLTITDALGCKKTGSTLITGIDEISGTNNSVIYPNPNTGEFILELTILNSKPNFKILNCLGQEVDFNQYRIVPSSHGFKFDLSTLSKGIYFMQIILKDSIIYNKVILE